MRIKKRQIIEAAQIDTSKTSTPQSQKPTDSQEIEKLRTSVQDLEKEIEDSPLMAFMKVSENTSGDIDDFTSDAMDAMADKSEKNRQDYDEWLQTPEGQEYIKSLESLQESINLKNRKVIKTIKVKDLK
jgi:hypothetical protein